MISRLKSDRTGYLSLIFEISVGHLGSDEEQMFSAQVLPVSDTHDGILKWERKEGRKCCLLVSDCGYEWRDLDSISVTST